MVSNLIMETFSTFDVSGMFNVDRTRLQEWLDRGFFVPYQKAFGKGTKAIFTRNDLYRLRLFIWLVDVLFNRHDAGSYSSIQFENVGPGKDQFKYAVWTIEFLEGEACAS